MSDQIEKNCTACDKRISAAAKKCPYCQTWQSAWGAQTPKPIFLLLIIFLVFGFWGTMRFLGFQEKCNVSYSHFQNPITVMDSDFHLTAESSKDKELHWMSTVTIGHIKNSTDSPWKKIRFEIQFFDKSGKMIDSTARLNDDLLIPPHGNVSFKVIGIAVHDKELYASHKVYIRWAEQSK